MALLAMTPPKLLSQVCNLLLQQPDEHCWIHFFIGHDLHAKAMTSAGLSLVPVTCRRPVA